MAIAAAVFADATLTSYATTDSRESEMQFYILMVDYGKSYPGKRGPSGFEAVTSPEHTRRQIVSEVADHLASTDREVHFVKFIDGNFCEDVTADIIEEAQALMLQAAE